MLSNQDELDSYREDKEGSSGLSSYEILLFCGISSQYNSLTIKQLSDNQNNHLFPKPSVKLHSNVTLSLFYVPILSVLNVNGVYC